MINRCSIAFNVSPPPSPPPPPPPSFRASTATFFPLLVNGEPDSPRCTESEPDSPKLHFVRPLFVASSR